MSKAKSLRLAAAIGLIAVASLLPVSPANAAAGQLCAANSDYADEDWITNLQLGTATPIASVQGVTYKDATATSIGTFAAGSHNNAITMSISVDMNQNPTDVWDENVFIWLDLNQDGKVDLTKERIFAAAQSTDHFTVPDSNAPTTKTYTFTGSFNMPAKAYNGTAIGRAMLQFVEPNGDPIMCNSDPDAYDPGVSAFEAGTVLDFKIDVTGGVTNPALANTGSNDVYVAEAGAALITAGIAALAIAKRRKRSL